MEKEWTTEAGLHAMIAITHFGSRKAFRCGYVAVPEDHLLYGKHYSDVVPALQDRLNEAMTGPIGKRGPLTVLMTIVNDGQPTPSIVFNVHGGLTFAGMIQNKWCFGFDCGHYNDGFIEPIAFHLRESPVRTIEYVIAECENLAIQLTTI